MYPTFAAERYYANLMGYAPSKIDKKRSSDQKAKDCQKYLQILSYQRLPWEPMIDNIIMYVNPGRRFIQADRDSEPGQQTGQAIYDDSAVIACNMLVDGLVGYLLPRNQPWFGLELPGKFNFPQSSGMRSWSGKRVDSYPQVQRWLQDSQDVMYSAFNRSNFYDVSSEFMRDGVSCGTAHILSEEDIPRASIVFTVPHFRECFIAKNQFGRVDTWYRIYKMSLRQLVEKFGLPAMIDADPDFRRQYESNMYSEREILHAIYPRSDFEPNRVDALNKRWESMWVYRKGGKILESRGSSTTQTDDAKALSQGGYDSPPMTSWRWRANNDEIYGRGPGHDAFISVALSNQMGRTNLITAQKSAEPPLGAWSNLRNSIQFGPNGVTYIDKNSSRGDIRQEMPVPLYNGVSNLPFNVEFQDRVRQAITQHFHSEVFTMVSQLTAGGKLDRPLTEQIAELQGEKAAILGTRIGNLQSELLDPIIYRVYSIEAAAGRIPSPPDILLESRHGAVEVQYLGPLAQAQTRLNKVRSIMTFNNLIEQIAQRNPTVIDVVDSDQEAKELSDAVGYPVSCLRDPRAVAQIRQQRNKMQQQEREAEIAPKLARAAASLSKSPEAGSVMQQLTGGGEAPAQ